MDIHLLAFTLLNADLFLKLSQPRNSWKKTWIELIFIFLLSSHSYQAILPCLLCVIAQILDHLTMENESNQSVSDIQMQNPVKQIDRSSSSSKCCWNHPNPSSNQFRKLAHMWSSIWFRHFGNWGEPPRSRDQNAKSCKTDREGP